MALSMVEQNSSVIELSSETFSMDSLSISFEFGDEWKDDLKSETDFLFTCSTYEDNLDLLGEFDTEYYSYHGSRIKQEDSHRE